MDTIYIKSPLNYVGGKYKILVLSKSFYKKVNYEDYDIMEFNVEE